MRDPAAFFAVFVGGLGVLLFALVVAVLVGVVLHVRALRALRDEFAALRVAVVAPAPAPVVEPAPAPVVEPAPAPVVEPAPAPAPALVVAPAQPEIVLRPAGQWHA